MSQTESTKTTRSKKKRSESSDTEKEKEPPTKKLQIEVEPELVIPEGAANVEYNSNSLKKPDTKINIKLEIPKKQDGPVKLERNKAFFCTDHFNGDNNFNPFSIVIADSERKAKELLKNKIDEVYKNKNKNTGKESVEDAFTLIRIDLFAKNARIISCFPKKVSYKKDRTPVVLETNQFKLFYCTDHYSKHPYPGISFVVAKDEQEAKIVLTELLAENFANNIPNKSMTLKEIPLSAHSAFVLYEGNVGGTF